MDSWVCAAGRGGRRGEVPTGHGQTFHQVSVHRGQHVVYVPSRGTFPSSSPRHGIEETQIPVLQRLHSGVGSITGALEASSHNSADVFDLHRGELVTNVTNYQQPQARPLPSAAEGVVTAVTVPGGVNITGTMGVLLRPHMQQ